MAGVLPPIVSELRGEIGHFVEKFHEAGKVTADLEAKHAGVMERMKAHSGMAFAAMGAAATGAGAVLLAAAEPQEKAEALLKAAVEQTGKSFDEYEARVKAAHDIQAKFGHGAADVDEALAKLTTAYHDPTKALEELHRADELAARSHITLSEAAQKLVMVHAGSAKALKEVGINMKDQALLIHEAQVATQNHEKAILAETAAQTHLGDLEARLHGVKKLSIAQQQQLEQAHLALATAQEKLKTTTDAEAAAQARATNASKDGEAQYNKYLDTSTAAEKVSATFGGQLEAMRTRVENVAGSVGKQLGPALTLVGPPMAMVGMLVQSGTLGMIAHAAAASASKVATVTWTAMQWLLNAALSANPIGLVVIAIAALVGGFILAYTHIKPFHDFVDRTWKVVGELWNQIANKLIPALVEGVKWLGEHGLLGPLGLIITHFDLFKKKVQEVWDHIRPIFEAIGKGLDMVGKATSAAGAVGGDILSKLPHFDSGGIIPGPTGAPQLVVAHGGEVVVNPYRSGGGSIGTSITVGAIHINGATDPQATAVAVREELLRMARRMPNLGLA